jgi:hypothetical protein
VQRYYFSAILSQNPSEFLISVMSQYVKEHFTILSHLIYSGTASRSAGSDKYRRPRLSRRGPAKRRSPSRTSGI